MQILFLFLFWLASLLSSTPNQQSIKRPDAKQTIPCIPVKLLVLNAKADDKGNILEWHTASEVNTREFIIERSADGKDFSLAFWITPKGSANTSTSYRHTDTSAGSQTYYRLRMVDANGKEQVSRIVAVNRQSVKS